jgi:hypothetical protein
MRLDGEGIKLPVVLNDRSTSSPGGREAASVARATILGADMPLKMAAL